jgi:Tol biopolymer transport system component/DNA-binding winged helix-turn-helix (wHTH) protein
MEQRCYEFDRFILDTAGRALWADGQQLILGDRAFSVLVMLVEHAGHLVEKRQLMDSVWADAIVIEDNLVQAVHELRIVLADDPRTPRFVQTVHRRGYRFVAPVKIGSSPELNRGQPIFIPRWPASGGALPGPTEEPSEVPIPRRLELVTSEWPAKGQELPKSWLAQHRLAAALSGGIVIVVAALVVALRLRSTGHDELSITSGAERYREVLSVPRGLIKPAFSPDGNFLAVVAPDPATGVHSLYLARLGAEQPLRLTADLDVRGPAPAFSPDGESILFTSYRQEPAKGSAPDIWEVPVLGGTPRVVVRDASAASPAPDGAALAFAAVGAGTTTIRVRWQNGKEIEVAPVGFWPRWSPDGRWIAYTTSNPEGGDGHLMLVRPDGSERQQLTASASQIYGLCWTPDSRRLVFSATFDGPFCLWRVGIDGEELARVTSGPGVASSPTVSPDGRRIAFSFAHATSGVLVADGLGRPAAPLVPEGEAHDLAISPDGSSLAVISGEGRRATVDVFELGTGKRRTLARLAATRLRWTPDGRALLVVAAASEGETRTVWSLGRTGGLPSALTLVPAAWDWPDLSPDGHLLAAVRPHGDLYELVVTSLPASSERVVATSPSIQGVRFSPDGHWLAWSGTDRPADAAAGGIWVVPTGEGPPRRLVADGFMPVWESTGRSMLFLRFFHLAGIWRVGMTGEGLTRVRGPELDFRVEGWDVTADGSRLALFMKYGTSSIFMLDATEAP